MTLKPYLVYLLLNTVTGRGYVGKTNNLPARLRKHKTDSNCLYLHRAIQRYGFDSFTVEVLGEYVTETEAFLAEERFIVERQTLKPFGYNLLPRDGAERRLPEESLQRLSKTLQGRNLNGTGGRSYVGVRRYQGGDRFQMRIRHRGARHEKLFATEIEAAEAYDKVAVYLQGVDAKVNFVDRMEHYVQCDLKAFFDWVCTKQWKRKTPPPQTP